MVKLVVMFAVLWGIAGCGETPGERALTGGAIGAGTGAVIGSTTAVGWVPGTIVGGLVGAGVGIVTTPLAW